MISAWWGGNYFKLAELNTQAEVRLPSLCSVWLHISFSCGRGYLPELHCFHISSSAKHPRGVHASHTCVLAPFTLSTIQPYSPCILHPRRHELGLRPHCFTQAPQGLWASCSCALKHHFIVPRPSHTPSLTLTSTHPSQPCTENPELSACPPWWKGLSPSAPGPYLQTIPLAWHSDYSLAPPLFLPRTLGCKFLAIRPHGRSTGVC